MIVCVATASSPARASQALHVRNVVRLSIIPWPEQVRGVMRAVEDWPPSAWKASWSGRQQLVPGP